MVCSRPPILPFRQHGTGTAVLLPRVAHIEEDKKHRELTSVIGIERIRPPRAVLQGQSEAGTVMVVRSLLDFAVRRSWLLLPSAAAGAGAAYASSGAAPVMAGGALLGLAPALATALVLELRGRRLRTPEDIALHVNLETLGVIERFKQTAGSAMPTDDYPRALAGYRQLALAIDRRHDAPRSLLVTSPGPEEGKSTTAANVATVLAGLGRKVVLVDGDLRWSSLRSTNPKAPSMGLSGLLQNYLHSPQLAVVRTNEKNLFLLPAGIFHPDPQELLSRPRLGDVFASLREMADYVIVDSPPVLEADDARLLARNLDATLLVLRAGKTRTREVKGAIRILSKVGTHPMGAVLNRARTTEQEAAQPVRPQAPIPASTPMRSKERHHWQLAPSNATVPPGGGLDANPITVRLAEQGLTEGQTAPQALRAMTVNAARLGHALHSARRATLRVIPPQDQSMPGVRSEYTADQDFTVQHQMPQAVPCQDLSVANMGNSLGVEEDEVSVEAVIARLEETLQLIRAIRQETSPVDSRLSSRS